MTAMLRLKSITCLNQQETFTDELYVTFNGRKIALPNMTQGNTKVLSAEEPFDGSASLSLFENDGDHWYDRDDHIGSHSISESPAPASLTLDFDEGLGSEGAHYQLVVDVTPV